MLGASESNCARIIASPVTTIQYAQQDYCEHQPADCCSEHAFPTRLSQLTSPGSAGVWTRRLGPTAFCVRCVPSNSLQPRSHLNYVSRAIKCFEPGLRDFLCQELRQSALQAWDPGLAWQVLGPAQHITSYHAPGSEQSAGTESQSVYRIVGDCCNSFKQLLGELHYLANTLVTLATFGACTSLCKCRNKFCGCGNTDDWHH